MVPVVARVHLVRDEDPPAPVALQLVRPLLVLPEVRLAVGGEVALLAREQLGLRGGPSTPLLPFGEETLPFGLLFGFLEDLLVHVHVVVDHELVALADVLAVGATGTRWRNILIKVNLTQI